MARCLVAAAALLWAVGGGGAEGSSCPSCELIKDEFRNITLNAIKQQILSKLGMKQGPNMTGRTIPIIPPLEHYFEREPSYPMLSDQPFLTGPSLVEETDDFTATPERVIALARSHPKLRHGRGQDVLYFEFSNKIQSSEVVRAQLWLYLKGGSIEDSITITVQKVLQIPSSGQQVIKSHVIAAKQEKRGVGRGRWISMDVQWLVSDWFKSPKENLGLIVQSSPTKDSRSPLVTSPNHHDISQVPFLEVHTREAKKQRTKRSIGLNCPENSEERRCCRYPLTVDFEEFGWDWIIAPKKYEANYCSGECPYVFLPNHPHAHIVKQAGPSGRNAGPCCAPRKLSSISMLYFDQKYNIIFSSLPGMVVDLCGCS